MVIYCVMLLGYFIHKNHKYSRISTQYNPSNILYVMSTQRCSIELFICSVVLINSCTHGDLYCDEDLDENLNYIVLDHLWKINLNIYVSIFYSQKGGFELTSILIVKASQNSQENNEKILILVFQSPPYFQPKQKHVSWYLQFE